MCLYTHCISDLLIYLFQTKDVQLDSSPLLWFGCGRQQKCHAAAPPPTGVRRRMERNRQKLVG